MRKLNLCLLTAALLLALTACGRQETPPPETPAPAAAPAETSPAVPARLVISEVMTDNAATLADDEGRFPDWVEFQNLDGEAVDLTGCTLRAGDGSWPLPTVRLEPGEFSLLSIDGGLSKKGERLRLLDRDGALLDELSVPPLGEDESYRRGEDGGFSQDRFASPGFANTEEGYISAQERLRPAPDGPAITEAMTYNEWYLPFWRWVGGDEVRSFHDWVEIANLTDEPLELSEYYLSDKEKDRLLYRLPEQLLEPGECAVVLCDKELDVGAPFGLSGEGEQLYLSRADGSLCDYTALHDIPWGMSQGRSGDEGGAFYFSEPSPGEKNEGGARLRASMPVAAEPDGVFENVRSVTVTLKGKGEIRYTLDGTEPTGSSLLYEGPITLKETAAVRAACFMPDRLRSEVLDLCYILNEGHSFPVVSLFCEPDRLFGVSGIYTLPLLDREVQAGVSFFDGEESFHIRCGLKLHGATSRITQHKKSFKLNFRPRFEGELHYDLFGNGVTDFSSILLRADQESSQSSYIRDNLMHRIAIESMPALCAQDGRWAILYLNGEYWGIYSLREAHSAEHYARHHGLETEQVLHWKSKWPRDSLAEELYRFAVQSDMREKENYEKVAAHLDLDSVIDWCLLQLYSANTDFNPPNMRFYWTLEDEKLHYALVDLDLGLFGQGTFQDVFGYVYDYDYLIGRLLRSADFRDLFLRRASQLLSGPLSDEAVLAGIGEMEEALRPEIQRDIRRWGDQEKGWDQMIGALKGFVTFGDGRARATAAWLGENLGLSEDEMKSYFPWN